MADIEQQVAALKKRIADAIRDRAGAEHQLAVARDRRQQAEAALRDQFGITPGEVPALEKRLEDDLLAETARVEKLLEQAEEKP